MKDLSKEELEIVNKVKNIIEQNHKDKNIGNKKINVKGRKIKLKYKTSLNNSFNSSNACCN